MTTIFLVICLGVAGYISDVANKSVYILFCGFALIVTLMLADIEIEQERFCAVNPTVEMCQEKE